MLIVDFCTVYDGENHIPYHYVCDLDKIDKSSIVDIRYYAKRYEKYKKDKSDKPSLVVLSILKDKAISNHLWKYNKTI